MPIDMSLLRAAAAAGASVDTILALVEAMAANIEVRRAKDREYQRARRRQTSTDVGRHRPTRQTSCDAQNTPTAGTQSAAASIQAAAGNSSFDPLGNESVDNSKKKLTKQDDSDDASLSSFPTSFPNLFSDSSNSQEKKEVDTRAREGKNRATQQAAESLFAKFWQAYPHKVGKRDAANAFGRVLKMKIVGIDDLMAGLARYSAKTDDRPWCNPSTWLNQGRWDDQPAEGHYQNGGGNGFQANRGAGGAVRMRIALARKRAAANNHTNHEEGGFAAPLQSRD
jgi:hypothetical protein